MLCCVGWLNMTNASDMLTASIIRAMMKVVSSSETSVNFYHTTWYNIPEDSHLETLPVSCCRIWTKTMTAWVTLPSLIEATFHISGYMKGHNLCTWGSESPRVVMEHERARAKVNVWCATAHGKAWHGMAWYGTITSTCYLYMLQLYAVPQIKEVSPQVIFQ
jgi:hypothetical protein